MTLRRAHTAGLTACASLAGLCTVLGVGPNPVSVALCVLGALGSLLGKRERGRRLSQPGAAALAVGLGAMSLSLRTGGAFGVPDAANVSLALIAARLLSAQYPSHDGQALMMMATVVCAATVLTPSPLLAPLLLAFVVALTVTMVTRQLLYDASMESFRHHDPDSLQQAQQRTDVVSGRTLATVALLALGLIGSGVLAFVAFPRTGLHALSFAAPDAGAIPNDVTLRGAPRAGGSDRPLVRAFGLARADFERGLYLRAGIYDVFAEGSFHLGRTPTARLAPVPHSPSAPRPWHYELRFLGEVLPQGASLGPLQRGWLHAASGDALALGSGEALSAALSAQSGSLARLSLIGLPWQTWTDVAADPAMPRLPVPAEASAAVPPGLDARIAGLASTLCPASMPAASCASAIRGHLATNATYSLEPTGAAQPDPIADFLFGGRRGHCEYYATAFVLLLRHHGVPARVVGGFASGRWDEGASTVVFTGHDAHAWVEWWHPNFGWVQDDATPPMQPESMSRLAQSIERWRRLWENSVLGYGADDQLAMLTGVRSRLRSYAHAFSARATGWWPSFNRPATSASAGLIAAAIALGIGIAIRQYRPRRWARQMRELLQGAAERMQGRPLAPHETIAQALQRLESTPGSQNLAAPWWPFLRAYEAERFGGANLMSKASRQTLLRKARHLAAYGDR